MNGDSHDRVLHGNLHAESREEEDPKTMDYLILSKGLDVQGIVSKGLKNCAEQVPTY